MPLTTVEKIKRHSFIIILGADNDKRTGTQYPSLELLPAKYVNNMFLHQGTMNGLPGGKNKKPVKTKLMKLLLQMCKEASLDDVPPSTKWIWKSFFLV